MTHQHLLSEVKKRKAGLKTSPALDLPAISYEYSPNKKYKAYVNL